MAPSLTEDLKRQIADGHALVVVGAGVSLAASGGAPEAGWQGLLLSGVERAREVGAGLDEEWAERRRGDIRSGRISDKILAAEAVTEALGGREGGEYRRWLEETVGVLRLEERSLPEALAGLGVPLATTNYDGLLEEATGQPAVTWQELARVQQVLRRQKPGILHLHGHFEQPSSVVLGVRSYEAVLGEVPAQAFQKALALLKSLVFVGFGAGLADPNFSALLGWLKEHFSGLPQRHFRLCRRGELETLQHEHEGSRVVPLAYGAEHSDLAPLLLSLAPPAAVAPAPKPATDPDFERYETVALEHHRRLRLVGVDAGDVSLSLDEVYVPLRFGGPGRRDMSDREERLGSEEAFAAGGGEFELEEIFTTPEQEAAAMGFKAPAPSSGRSIGLHRVLLGDPGSGKTTALLKLLALCLTEGAESLGLAAGTWPVFLRLRRLEVGDLTRPLSAFLERELAELLEGELPSGLGKRLWRRGDLLLLLDGLDEIPDTRQRQRVCEYLERELKKGSKRGVRAVVSCRKTAYGEIRHGRRKIEIRLDESFLPVEVRPLDADQCSYLVRKWFGALPAAVPDLTPAAAHTAAEGLVEALGGEGFAGQRLKVLVGSPLLLTLLCVVVWRGGEMPRHRVAFYRECLRVLLSRWTKLRKQKSPLEADPAIDLLRSLAWKLHSEERREDLSRPELLLHIRRRLGEQGETADPAGVLEWLHWEAGVLAEMAPGRYGFMHLGLQEYLAALHVTAEGGEVLETLRQRCSQRWWHEVVLLAVGIPRAKVFAPLMEALVSSEALFEQGELIRLCLDEAAAVDLSPFLAVLVAGEAPERQAAVLRLLRGRRDEALVEAATALLDEAQGDVRELIRQLCAEAARGEPAAARETEATHDLALVAQPELLGAAQELAAELGRRGLRVKGPIESGELEWAFEELSGGAVRGVAVAVAVAVGTGDPAWELPEVASCLELLALDGVPLVPVKLAGKGKRPTWPEAFRPGEWLDLRHGFGGEEMVALERALAGVVEPAEQLDVGAEVVAGENIIVEHTTGMRFLPVAGGRLRMGQEGLPDATPVHTVRLSPFWLAETPVTNEQYGRFLEATKHREPFFWRDRRFSDRQQPVVGVSWKQAMGFCHWLSEVAGREVTLPSEAQWELAARGEEGRSYPWGEEEPDESRACYGQDWQKGRPAPVGNYPAGRGPYGHLDLAGNVWEWCRDVWDEQAYVKRVGAEMTEPLVTEGDRELRCLRGGGWDNSAEKLRSAIRGRFYTWSRDTFIGFRVAVVSASTGAS